jgi:ABC-2 type transport system permease protein
MKQLSGAWRLTLLALRRDRVKLSIAVVSVGTLLTMMVLGVSEIFASDKEMREGIAFLAANPAMRLFGLPTGAEFGNLLMLRTFTMWTIIVALINTFTVVRHTRQNEELNRTELLGSYVTGRYAPLVSALAVAGLVNVLIVVLAFAGLSLGDVPTSGAFAMALAIGLVGMAFATLTAVLAQLTQTSRGANGLAAASVIVAFLFSGIASVVGDLSADGMSVDPAWLIWLSPIGWGQLLYPFADENWAIIWIFVVAFVACILAAVWLLNRRDIGGSIFAARAGRAEASGGLLSTTGLTWRLQRTSFITWLSGITILGIIYGTIAPDVESILGQAEGIAEIFVGATGSDQIMLAFFGSITGMLGLFILAYGVSALLRVRSEEDRALEPLLSTKLGRTKWLATNALFVLAGIFTIAAAAGLATGLTAQLLLDGFDDIVWQVIIGVVLQLPAIALLLGIIVLVFGLLPRATNFIAWTVVSLSIVIGPLFYSLLNLPEGFGNISPLAHTPVVPPTDNIELQPVIVMISVALVLMISGALAFRQRDITTK